MKGISPFIAIILLVAITVSVGSLISMWYFGLLGKQTETIEEETTTKIRCIHGSILIWDSTIKCDFSGATDYLNFTVENTGTIDLYNLKVQINNGSLIFGPYNVTDILTGSTFNSSFPLKPGWKRDVKVDITDDIVGNKLEWINIITQCVDVEDKSYNIPCS
jgi:flagellin-like protein